MPDPVHSEEWSNVATDELVKLVRAGHFTLYGSAAQALIIGELTRRKVPGVDIAFLERRWEATQAFESRTRAEREPTRVYTDGEVPDAVRKTAHEMRFLALFAVAVLIFLHLYSGGDVISNAPLAGGIVFAALQFFVGNELSKRKNWARSAAFLLAGLTLLGVPIGTIVGAVWFVRLGDRNVAAWFDARK